jgi:dephospho-CoA kinase
LVAIAADQRVRYDRCVARGENEGDKLMSFEDFCTKDTAEAEAQIPEVMSKAKFTIDNGGTIEDLYRKIDEIVQQISTP